MKTRTRHSRNAKLNRNITLGFVAVAALVVVGMVVASLLGNQIARAQLQSKYAELTLPPSAHLVSAEWTPGGADVSPRWTYIYSLREERTGFYRLMRQKLEVAGYKVDFYNEQSATYMTAAKDGIALLIYLQPESGGTQATSMKILAGASF